MIGHRPRHGLLIAFFALFSSLQAQEPTDGASPARVNLAISYATDSGLSIASFGIEALILSALPEVLFMEEAQADPGLPTLKLYIECLGVTQAEMNGRLFQVFYSTHNASLSLIAPDGAILHAVQVWPEADAVKHPYAKAGSAAKAEAEGIALVKKALKATLRTERERLLAALAILP